MHLIAQAAPAAPGGPPPNWVWGVVAAVGACYLFGFLLIAIVLFFFLRTLARTLERCSPDLRTMTPGSVWLNLIPPVAVVWLFVTVIRVGDSLKLEFLDRRLDDEQEEGCTFGKTLGLTGLLLMVLSCGACCVPIPLGVAAGGGGGGGANVQVVAIAAGILRTVMSIAFLVVFILYWVRIAGYGRILADDDDRHDTDEDDRMPFDQERTDDDPDHPTDPPPLPPGDGR